MYPNYLNGSFRSARQSQSFLNINHGLQNFTGPVYINHENVFYNQISISKNLKKNNAIKELTGRHIIIPEPFKAVMQVINDDLTEDISNDLPLPFTVYCCGHAISQNVTSDADGLTVAPAELLDKLFYKGQDIGNYTVTFKRMVIGFESYNEILKITKKVKPVLFLRLTHKFTGNTYRIDISCIKNIADIGDPYSLEKTNFYENTFVTNGKFIWNCAAIYRGDYDNGFKLAQDYISTGKLHVISYGEMGGDLIQQNVSLCIQDPIHIFILLNKLAALQLLSARTEEEKKKLQSENLLFAKQVMTKLNQIDGPLNYIFTLLRQLPKKVVVNRLVRALGFGEAESNFLFLKETGVLKLILLFLSQPVGALFDKSSFDILKKIEDMLSRENKILPPLFKTWDSQFNADTKISVDEHKICALILYVMFEKIENKEKLKTNIDLFFNDYIQYKENNEVLISKDLILEFYPEKIEEPILEPKELTIEERLAKKEAKKARLKADKEKKKEEQEKSLLQMEKKEELSKVSKKEKVQIKKIKSKENTPPIIHENQKETMTPKINIVSADVIHLSENFYKEITEKSTIEELKNLIDEIILREDNKNQIKIINKSLKKLKVSIEDTMIIDKFYFEKNGKKVFFYLSIYSEGKKIFSGRQFFNLDLEKNALTIKQVINEICMYRNLKFNKNNDITMYVYKDNYTSEYRYGTFILNEMGFDFAIDWNRCFAEGNCNQILNISSINKLLHTNNYEIHFNDKNIFVGKVEQIDFIPIFMGKLNGCQFEGTVRYSSEEKQFNFHGILDLPVEYLRTFNLMNCFYSSLKYFNSILLKEDSLKKLKKIDKEIMFMNEDFLDKKFENKRQNLTKLKQIEEIYKKSYKFEGEFNLKEGKISFLDGDLLRVINSDESLCFKCIDKYIDPRTLYQNKKLNNLTFYTTWHFAGESALYLDQNVIGHKEMYPDYNVDGLLVAGVLQQGTVLSENGDVFELVQENVFVFGKNERQVIKYYYFDKTHAIGNVSKHLKDLETTLAKNVILGDKLYCLYKFSDKEIFIKRLSNGLSDLKWMDPIF